MALLLGWASIVSAGDGLESVRQGAVTCGVSAESVDRIETLRSSGKATDEMAESLLSPLLAACVEQLPLAPLQDKLAEGTAKHVPPPFIVRALNKLLGEYRFARQLLMTTRGSASPEALSTIGEGLDKGVPREDFETYVHQYSELSEEVFTTGVTMISLQGQADFSYALSKRIIDRGVQTGELSSGWKYFVRIILAARKRGMTDERIADAAVAVMDAGGSVSDVMNELGFTSRYLGGERKAD